MYIVYKQFIIYNNLIKIKLNLIKLFTKLYSIFYFLKYSKI